MTSAIASVSTNPAELMHRHQATLDGALAAIASREYFSHATGLNPAANSSLTDLAFVTPRFHVVQSRRHVAEAHDV
jgi:hypothetical protein